MQLMHVVLISLMRKLVLESCILPLISVSGYQHHSVCSFDRTSLLEVAYNYINVVNDRLGAIFFIVMNQVFSNLSAVDVFIKQKALFIYEIVDLHSFSDNNTAFARSDTTLV